MVAQKLNKSHGPGGATASSDLLNKLQQAPGRNNPIADSILAKEQISNLIKIWKKKSYFNIC